MWLRKVLKAFRKYVSIFITSDMTKVADDKYNGTIEEVHNEIFQLM